MSFWDGETCEHCGGAITERIVEVTRKVRGKYVLIENVPAGVCGRCGLRYFAAAVLKAVDEAVRGRGRARREVVVPVYTL